jgi:Ca2+-binding RTX toxin-like protein
MVKRVGTGGADTLRGTSDPDTLVGFGGDDTLFGGGQTDHIFGDSGDDVLSGDGGADFLYGGTGKDVLAGGTGNDHMWGGAGADTFFFAKNTDTGTDRIYDYNPHEDTIAFFTGDNGVSGHATATWIFDITSGGFDVTIDFEDAGKVILENISVFDINATINSIDFV